MELHDSSPHQIRDLPLKREKRENMFWSVRKAVNVKEEKEKMMNKRGEFEFQGVGRNKNGKWHGHLLNGFNY